ncbi:hypothetical protein BpHYR1_027031 [Brachionus plicatilis]|uniref:Uncharacterized protein n=1 Tax=Brachionus plicatilis TaxID=10195 RepID=A0A3M7PBX8_BRAPC|nr:hypothetical protein BpHYR1_027031 [Brachionus plicatilis]
MYFKENLKKVNTLQDCEITSLVTANFCFQWSIRCRSLFDCNGDHFSNKILNKLIQAVNF